MFCRCSRGGWMEKQIFSEHGVNTKLALETWVKNSGLVQYKAKLLITFSDSKCFLLFSLHLLKQHLFSQLPPGNELLHNLTNVGPVSLRVDMRSGNHTVYAHYTNFSVDSETRHYTLTMSGYTGTAGPVSKTALKQNKCSYTWQFGSQYQCTFLTGDSMRYHNGRPFSTRDKNPDPMGIHCAKAYMGGWWYKNCYKVNLNGLYGINSNNQVRLISADF